MSERARMIPVRNVWHMLIYAWDLMRWQDAARYESETSPDLLGLLARVLVDSTHRLLRRGRICFAPSLRYIGNKENKLVCEFNILDIDTPRNQIIKGTFEQLAYDDRVRGSLDSDTTSLHRDIRELIRAMDGIQSTRLSNGLFSRVQLGRNDRYYALPLQICSLIHQLRMPTERSGTSMLAKLLRDEVGFASLFEKFVRNFYRHHVGHLFEVKSENLEWPGQQENPLMPIMRTDISLVRRDPPRERLIIDTKYYREALVSNRGGALKFTSQNLYQIYAYLRTQEWRGDDYRNARGMLLYPTVDRRFDEEVDIQGHNIRVSTIDLADTWEAIESRLLSYV